MFSSLPSATTCTGLPAGSFVSASKCTIHFSGSRMTSLKGAERGPGFSVPTTFFVSHLRAITMRAFCPAEGLHSPCQVPDKGCPSWANDSTVKQAKAQAKATALALRIITGSLQYISATSHRRYCDILVAILLLFDYSGPNS